MKKKDSGTLLCKPPPVPFMNHFAFVQTKTNHCLCTFTPLRIQTRKDTTFSPYPSKEKGAQYGRSEMKKKKEKKN